MRAIAVVGIAVLVVGCTSPEEKERKACEDSIMAFVMSQNFVKQHLKSPEAAKFPYVNSPGVVVQYLGQKDGCKHYVEAYVDAPNSFGVSIRNKYYVVMEKVANKSYWRAHHLEIK